MVRAGWVFFGTSPRSVKHPKGGPVAAVALSPALGFLPHRVSARSIRVLVWFAGLIALLATIVPWALPPHPYQAPWAWTSFIGLCIGGGFLSGSDDRAAWRT